VVLEVVELEALTLVVELLEQLIQAVAVAVAVLVVVRHHKLKLVELEALV
jgi:hypothetical protein